MSNDSVNVKQRPLSDCKHTVWYVSSLSTYDNTRALDKILSNWVLWAIFTHTFLIKLCIRIFLLGTLFYYGGQEILVFGHVPHRFIYLFIYFDLGFMALSRIFHLYRAGCSSKVGKNWRTWGKTTWPSVRRTWLSHMWPEWGLNHSGEKPNWLRVNSPIH